MEALAASLNMASAYITIHMHKRFPFVLRMLENKVEDCAFAYISAIYGKLIISLRSKSGHLYYICFYNELLCLNHCSTVT